MNPSTSVYIDLVAVNYIKDLRHVDNSGTRVQLYLETTLERRKSFISYGRYSTFIDTIIAVFERFDPDITNCDRIVTFTTRFGISSLVFGDGHTDFKFGFSHSDDQDLCNLSLIKEGPDILLFTLGGQSNISLSSTPYRDGAVPPIDSSVIALMTAYKGFSVWRNAFTLLSVLNTLYLPAASSYAYGPYMPFNSAHAPDRRRKGELAENVDLEVRSVLRTRSYFPTYFVEYEEISEAVESLDKKRKGQGQGQGSREDEEESGQNFRKIKVWSSIWTKFA
ncbi:hypothetical protein K435DRAFT_791339 [Dendrothele bispora CBS 962.96]|uniref:Uncharacterized protein n=1 Tax=Dendrothele bispora (strain CBS 962.96) TaxID=1314807 RepID=A0A4S8MNX2_DENBC|nr:hypothetical protein K435DRAFT_791339 [Dendrothele bispora CBS 962.96]